ncbi:winged helix-turn-helix transcriptional regulator [Salinisphaera aquimarina]|uniref:Winged helix-turn-helix transcriptional regulator n=1 Tax=Salinisphaera aquimarina TaxID=2094031 RepID=A0ABV7EUM1_9GAMM
MMKKPGEAVKGSDSGRPIMVLFDLLGRRWTLRILWELRHGRLTFRALQSRCDEISPTMLNRRIKELRELNMVDHEEAGYGHTPWGAELSEHLMDLSRWSDRWAKSL